MKVCSLFDFVSCQARCLSSLDQLTSVLKGLSLRFFVDRARGKDYTKSSKMGTNRESAAGFNFENASSPINYQGQSSGDAYPLTRHEDMAQHSSAAMQQSRSSHSDHSNPDSLQEAQPMPQFSNQYHQYAQPTYGAAYSSTPAPQAVYSGRSTQNTSIPYQHPQDSNGTLGGSSVNYSRPMTTRVKPPSPSREEERYLSQQKDLP